MYAFNGSSGSQNWFGSVPQYDGWTPAVDGKYAYAYTGGGVTTPIEGDHNDQLATGATAATVSDPGYDWTGYTMNEAVAVGRVRTTLSRSTAAGYYASSTTLSGTQ